MTTLRAFVAIPLADPARRAAARAVEALRATPRGRGVRWVRPESYHVTLRFLGEIPESRVEPLGRAVGDAVAEAHSFALSLGALAAFPSPRRPRVVAVTLAPEAPLRALAARVEAGVVAAGFAPETRPFRPHLTLGRVRDRVVPALPAEPLVAPRSPVTEVVLFRSELREGGARHAPLRRMALSGPDVVTPTETGASASRKPGPRRTHGEERPSLRAS